MVCESGGTDHDAADYALSGGWGATATLAVVDAPDLRGIVDVSAAGAGQAANPTVVLTFADGAYTSAPNVVPNRGDTLATAGEWRVTAQAGGSVTFTFIGTPVATETYRLLYHVIS